jgi:hypothetical protein
MTGKDTMNLQKRLEYLLNEHRNKSKITCNETCFCWDVDRLLVSIEQSREQVNPFSRASVKRAAWSSIYKSMDNPRTPSTVERVITLLVVLLLITLCILNNF